MKSLFDISLINKELYQQKISTKGCLPEGGFGKGLFADFPFGTGEVQSNLTIKNQDMIDQELSNREILIITITNKDSKS